MITLKVLTKKEKREIEGKLSQQFGIKKIPGILVKMGVERIFLFQGDFNEKDIRKLEGVTFIERLGIYFAKIEDWGVRLSIEGTWLLRDQIKKNIFELDEKQAEDWMMGRELQIKTGKRGFLVMKYEDNFMGCGKASEEKITNFIPKNRRLKQKQVSA